MVVTGLFVGFPDKEVLYIVFVPVMFVLVGGCTICDAILWFVSTLSFLAASRQVHVNSVRNICLDSAEGDINLATSVTHLGTAYEWAGVVGTSGFSMSSVW